MSSIDDPINAYTYIHLTLMLNITDHDVKHTDINVDFYVNVSGNFWVDLKFFDNIQVDLHVKVFANVSVLVDVDIVFIYVFHFFSIFDYC